MKKLKWIAIPVSVCIVAGLVLFGVFADDIGMSDKPVSAGSELVIPDKPEGYEPGAGMPFDYDEDVVHAYESLITVLDQKGLIGPVIEDFVSGYEESGLSLEEYYKTAYAEAEKFTEECNERKEAAEEAGIVIPAEETAAESR